MAERVRSVLSQAISIDLKSITGPFTPTELKNFFRYYIFNEEKAFVHGPSECTFTNRNHPLVDGSATLMLIFEFLVCPDRLNSKGTGVES